MATDGPGGPAEAAPEGHISSAHHSMNESCSITGAFYVVIGAGVVRGDAIAEWGEGTLAFARLSRAQACAPKSPLILISLGPARAFLILPYR